MKSTLRNIWFWAFVLLLAFNIASVSSFFVMRHHHLKACEPICEGQNINSNHHPLAKMLDLNQSQWQQMREVQHKNRIEMNLYKSELDVLHAELFEEISSQNPAAIRIDSLKSEICKVHGKIADASIEFYTNAKQIVPAEKVDSLNTFFKRRFLKPDRQPRPPYHQKNVH